ncbi:hypothetical protein L204_100366 [Cryptococcus depauperatus]|nr:hypothetical protein L204_02151 [Cryptococcus depauperatus CBS 7855]
MVRLFSFARKGQEACSRVPTQVDATNNVLSQYSDQKLGLRLAALFQNNHEPHNPTATEDKTHTQKLSEVGTDTLKNLQPRDKDVVRSATYPLTGFETSRGPEAMSITIPPEPQRQAIKVLIVTWNMADALPKGDLSVLLGKIPPYEPESPIEGELPDLPIGNSHPYHIIVIAGQECPTPSGAPRGLGGGIIKGVNLRNRREAKEKEKDGEKDDAGHRSPCVNEEEDERMRPSSPTALQSPFVYKHTPPTKGWSQMLDDYLCVPSARHGLLTPLPSNPNLRELPLSTDKKAPMNLSPRPATAMRSVSVPIAATSSVPFLKPPSPQEQNYLHPFVSPLSRQSTEFNVSDSDEENYFSHDVTSNDNLGHSRYRIQDSLTSPTKSRNKRPQIVIPTDEENNRQEGGSYVHVVKERLMGMYLSIYVYKGAEHLVKGLDKDFVTAGLAGGRVGNKGGIGISLKIADRTFLFVNSHLAAHTERMELRKANITKIKKELQLDCFLAKDDPRAQEEDITDRFDTVFWCGDLNFRVELSRLHADWLIEQKRYADALTFDQLHRIIDSKDPEVNPFVGFKEALIDFPCTFKYDVWKSVRATNKNLRRTLKRQKSSISTQSAPADGEHISKTHETSLSEKKKIHKDNLSGLSEADAIEEMYLDKPNRHSEDEENRMSQGREQRETNGYDSEEENHLSIQAEDVHRQSFDSSQYNSGIDIESDSDNNTYQHRSQPRTKNALREKTRHLLGLVKMNGILTPSPRRRKGRMRGMSLRSTRNMKNQAREGDTWEDRNGWESRRTSLSSLASTYHGTEYTEYTADTDNRPISFSSFISARDLASSSIYGDSHDRPGLARSDTLHDLTYSAKASGKPFLEKTISLIKRTSSSKSIRESAEDESDFEMDLDRREGVYDSSKKQRVPSWCDRVLWKTQITPDPLTSVLETVQENAAVHEGSLSRIQTGFHSALNHFRHRLERFPTREPSTSSISSRKAEEAAKQQKEEVNLDRLSEQVIHTEGGETIGIIVASPPETPDLDVQQNGPNWGESGLIPAPKGASPDRSSAKDRFFPISQSIPATTALKLSSLANDESNKIIVNSQSAPDPPRRQINFNPLRESSIAPPMKTDRENELSGFQRWLQNLPSWLHRSDHKPKEEAEAQKSKRWQKGEVQCLHYGTIDDSGMKLLEGRSDHRPAIFAAAVYV